MQPNLHDETADRAAEERSEDDGMAEHRAKAGDPARRAASTGAASCGKRRAARDRPPVHL